MRKVMSRNATVNIAKAVTIACLLAFSFLYPVSNRAAVYLGMHLSYCVWYLLRQSIISRSVINEQDNDPNKTQDQDNVLNVTIIIALIGVFYALPGWLAFTNSQPAGNLVVGSSVALFFFGSIIVSSVDVQKSITTLSKPGLLLSNLWGLSRNIRYFGELIRYSAFALLAGSPWAWSVVLCVLIFEHPYGLLRWLKRVASGSRSIE